MSSIEQSLLFRHPDHTGDWSTTACVGLNTGVADNSIGYVGGFQSAAEFLLRVAGVSKPLQASENWGNYPLIDMLVYPICFGARQHVELSLKRAIPRAWRLFKTISPTKNMGLSEPKKVLTHDLLQLWEQLDQISEKTHSELHRYVRNIEPYIRELAKVDATGQTFRYAYDSDSSALHLEDMSLLDLQFFANGYADLSEHLESLNLLLLALPDEIATGTFTAKLNRDQLGAIAQRLPPRTEWGSDEFLGLKNELLLEYGLSAREFSRACDAILRSRGLAPLVDAQILIPELTTDLFTRMKAVNKSRASAPDALTLHERSIIFAVREVGGPYAYAEEFDEHVAPHEGDENSMAQYENERDARHQCRKVSQAPYIFLNGLRKLGQADAIRAPIPIAHGLASSDLNMPPQFQKALGGRALALVLLMSIALPACTGARMKPVYSQSMVEPVTVEKRSDTEIAVRYKVRPESSHYSGGVDFERVGDVLRIVIGRCAVGSKCEPMAKSVIPLDDSWQAEVHLPFDGARVIVVHADGEKQVYP